MRKCLSKYITFFLVFSSLFSVNALDYYWVGGQGNWSDFSNHWATSSGGTTFHSSAPGISDDVYFDDNSTTYQDTVFIDVSATCNHLILNGYAKVLQNNVLTVTGTFNLLAGELIVNSNTLNVNQFYSKNTFLRTLNIDNSTLNLTGVDTVWNISLFSFTFNQINSTININHPGNNMVVFNSGSELLTYQNLICSTKHLKFIDKTSFNNLTLLPGSHIHVPTLSVNGLTNELLVNNFTANGTCSNFITIEGEPTNTFNPQFNLNLNGGSTNANYLRLKNCNGSNGTYNANNALDLGNNTNWTITEEPSNGIVRWINNSGNWSDPTHWSTGCIPGPNDIVVFDAASFSLPNQTVNVDIDAYSGSMHWNGVTGTPNLIGSNQQIVIKDSALFDANMLADFSGEYVFNGTNTTNLITTNNVLLNGDFIFKSTTGQWSFTDNFSSTTNIILNEGIINCSNLTITVNGVLSSTSNTRNFDVSNSNITLTGIDSVWVINATNLTSNLTNSVITVNHSNPNNSIVDGGGLTYNEFNFLNPKSSLLSSNIFNLLKIGPGKTLSIENSSNQSADSIIALGFCDSIITIESIDQFGTAANITKTGYDSLFIDYVNLFNITAATPPQINTATNSNGFFNTSGWVITNTTIVADYYWVGGTGNWSDTSNWESPLGTPAGCLPNIKDTVHFNLNGFNATNQTVTVDVDAYFAKMEWSGSEVWNPILEVNRNLICRDSIILNNTLSVTSSNLNVDVRFIPNLNNSVFVTYNRPIPLNLVHKGMNITDTLTLNGNLVLDSLHSVYVVSGNFNTNSDSIYAQSFISNGTNLRQISLNNSYIELKKELDFTNLTALQAGTSYIYLNSNEYFAYFNGNDLTYYDVALKSTGLISSIYLNQSNSYNDLILMPGTRVKVEDAATQSILNNFIAKGTCIDSIFISSQTDGTVTNFNLSNNDTAEVCSIKDVNISSANLTALFSTDKGNNSGINFDTTPTSVPSFTTPYQECLGNITLFTNTSTAISGLITDLTFDWDFGDDSTSNLVNPTHIYSETGKFYITLTATYTNLCKETYLDSININHPVGQLTSNSFGNTICDGTQVIISGISSPSADTYNFFINGISVQNTASNVYTTSTLANNDVVTLNVTLNGCSNQSDDTLTFTVNPLPPLNVISSDVDNVICDGDLVTYTATGADVYKFYINSIAQTVYTTNNVFSVNTLINNDTVWVSGKDTVTGCELNSSFFIMTVNPIPAPNLASSDVNSVICDGDVVTFTGTGSGQYEFLINNITVQGPSALNTYTTTGLVNGDVISLIGHDLGCSGASSTTFNFVVNPIPNVMLTNSTGLNICQGDTVAFNASGASIYEFFIDGVSVQGPSASPSYSTNGLTNNQTVYVTGTALGCSADSPMQTFNVTPLPIVNLTCSDIDTLICQYDLVTFNASGANNYQFLLDGFPIGSFANTSVYNTTALNNNQTISVLGEINGCINQSLNYYTFTVIPSFNVNLLSSDADLTICEGESIDFTGLAGSGVTSYDLYDNGTLINSNTTGIFSITTLNSGTHAIALSATKNGCTYFANDTLSILVKPNPIVSITSSDADNIICSGDTIIFSATGATTYDFLIDGISQGISTQDSLIIWNLNNGQTVSVNGYTNGCQGSSSSIITTVNAIPNITLTSDDIDNIICEGDPINFTAGGATNYEFFINSTSQGVSTVNTLNLNPTTNTLIEVVGESNNCFSPVVSINVTVNPLPIINVVISDPDTTICAGESVTITGSGAATYQLLINNIPTASPTTQNIYHIANIQNNDVVTMQGFSVNQCANVSSDIFTFTVKPMPIVNLTSSDPDTTICIGDVVTFNASGANTYDYYINGSYVTSTNPYITDSIQNGQIITVSGDLDGCVSISNPLQFTVHSFPITSISTTDNDTTICVGDSITFIGNGAFDYEFFVNGVSVQGPNSLTTFTTTTLNNNDIVYVEGINNGCGSNSDTINVTVIPYPNTILVSSDLDNEICYGEQVTFTTNGATTYEFYINADSQGPASSNQTFVTTTLNHNDSIWAIGYNGNCATNAAQSFVMTVHTLPLTLTSNSSNLICDGESVSFTASGADSYEFFVDGNSVQGPSTNPVFTSNTLQNGQLVTVNGFSTVTGCTQQAQTSHTLTVMNIPVISTLNATTICEGDSVVLVSSAPNWNQWYYNTAPILNANDTFYNAYLQGDYHTEITLGGNGTVIAIGNNAFGQFGDSTTISSFYKVDTKNLQNISKISSGENHNIAIDMNGIVYTWGKNDYGQIGDGTYTSSIIPYTVNLNNVIEIAAGHNSSYAILQNGTVMSWGKNDYGQLGQGNNSTSNFPFNINGLSNVGQIAAGKNHAIALLNDGTLMAWGDNQFGQLGLGNFNNYNIPQPITSISGIASINCGANHTLAVDSLGRLYVWGNNAEGQLGLNSINFSNTPTLHSLSNIKVADGGFTHSIALTNDQKLYSWGNNSYGQLGNNTSVSSISPIQIQTLDAVSTVRSNFYQNFVLKNDNTVWSWGLNSSGQLGTENTTNQLQPVRIENVTGAVDFGIGSQHTVFLTGFSKTCPSNTISIIVNSAPNVSLTMTNGTLSVSPVGLSYQWFINGIIIPNANTSTFTPVTTGYYTCEVTFSGGCSSLSDAYPFGIIGLKAFDTNIAVYPNPNSGTFNISGLELSQVEMISITNSLGQNIPFSEIKKENATTISIQAVPGLYYLNLRFKNKTHIIRKINVIN